jgi:hypothetical protein
MLRGDTMKHVILLLILLLSGVSQAVAMGQPFKAPLKIRFIRHAPREIKQLLPHGVISHFWGTFRMRSKGALQGVCLYDPNWQRNKQRMRSGNNKIGLFADLFEYKSKKWKRVRHCNLSYYGFVDRRMQVVAELLWLRPKVDAPILKFRIFTYDGTDLSGAGKELLVIFPRGFKYEFTFQRFSVGYWRASDTLSQDLSYDDVDRNGFLKITSRQNLNDDIWTDRTTFLIWKPRAKRFIPIWSKIYGGVGKPQVTTDPQALKEIGL